MSGAPEKITLRKVEDRPGFGYWREAIGTTPGLYFKYRRADTVIDKDTADKLASAAREMLLNSRIDDEVTETSRDNLRSALAAYREAAK